MEEINIEISDSKYGRNQSQSTPTFYKTSPIR